LPRPPLLLGRIQNWCQGVSRIEQVRLFSEMVFLLEGGAPSPLYYSSDLSRKNIFILQNGILDGLPKSRDINGKGEFPAHAFRS
jgi:hypothetical protein